MHNKEEISSEKLNLHPRNKHRGRYDFEALIKSCPELAPFVRLNEYQNESIDFANAGAVLMLNKALLKHFYDIDQWKIPPGYLCPPIPGRVDYLHHVADLLGSCRGDLIPTGKHIRCLDVGVGANAIYPILGSVTYGWSFVGTDIDAIALASAAEIMNNNMGLKENVELRLQPHARDIFSGIMYRDEHFDVTICNPPFHASAKEAQKGTQRKWKNLKDEPGVDPVLNFGGQNQELCCDGGEEGFVLRMITESKHISSLCLWFTTLISKQAHLKSLYSALKKAGVYEIITIPMGQGNKISRIVAWTFLNREAQRDWIKSRWEQVVRD
ncbi:MAG: 23S rRNA (adenine(1618)-N(6))-methyltransferase RlmF [Saprospiraceae bacterium]|nr:23S rRNA (adenine(1618)-N(6))-methyltransferase RlmF [Saprospiraceae bacterium]